MARIRHLVVGLLSVAALVAVSLTTSVQTHRTQDTGNLTFSGAKGGYTISVAPMIAMAADNVVLNVPRFEYPKPVNDPKWDNRIYSFAQNQRSWNVAAHYRS